MIRTRPVLAVFIDGLKPDSLRHTPFLSSVGPSKRITTDVGYSITCHSTMYTGVHPNKHKMWFLWQYNRAMSPFRWMGDTEAWDLADILPVRYFLGKMTRLFSDNRSYAGVSIMKFSSIKQWRNFAPTERKLWHEPRYVEDHPTIFDLMRSEGVSVELVGLTDQRHGGGSLRLIESYCVPKDIPQFTYLFIGECDHVSHVHGQESPQGVEMLGRIDRQVNRVYDQMTERAGHPPALVCWSDHGHMLVEKRLDIYPFFASRGLHLRDVLHIIDTNFARFWVNTDRQRQSVEEILAEMPSGRILTEEDCLHYHVNMPDRRYGDIVFYLDYPWMFKKTVWGAGLRTRSIHGYLPDYPEADGVFVSNVPASDLTRISLVDIAPSLLKLLEVDTDAEMDGEPVWQ